MRPGEKLHEKLFYDAEVRLHTPLVKVMRAQGRMPRWQVLSHRLAELQLLPYYRNAELIRAKIKQIIPEYEWEPVELVSVADVPGPEPAGHGLLTQSQSAA
jgi:FlaA1/EpsC-like NDP-sugar epimerase